MMMKDFDDHDMNIIFDERVVCTLGSFCENIEMGKNLSSKNYVYIFYCLF